MSGVINDAACNPNDEFPYFVPMPEPGKRDVKFPGNGSGQAIAKGTAPFDTQGLVQHGLGWKVAIVEQEIFFFRFVLFKNQG